MKKKELYAAPETEVLELHLEQAILDASIPDASIPDLDEQNETWG